MNRGKAKAELKRYSEAIADYEAIELDPKLALAYHNRGVAKAQLKQYSEAIADLDKAIELDPNLHQPTRTEASQKLNSNNIAKLLQTTTKP